MKKLISITYSLNGHIFTVREEMEWLVSGNLMTARVNEFVKAKFGRGAKLTDWEQAE